MKRTIAVFLAVCLLLGLCVGCQNEETKEAPVSSVVTSLPAESSIPSSSEASTPQSGTTTTFQQDGVTLQYPSHWKTSVQQGEDGRKYQFRDPTLGDQCEFSFYLTGAEYKSDITQEECMERLSYSYSDVTISTFETQPFAGYEATKIEATYAFDNTKFVEICYHNVVTGVRMYNFYAIYPHDQADTYRSVFESIFMSITIEQS